ncbi:MAG TPA: AAA family ATPase [Polyangiaceae bacterium]|nr:AAA family ATPase [Polyangiaceae bacterium]
MPTDVVPPLRLRTLLFVRTLGGGDALCAPLADASLVSLGPEDEALLEQKICLAEHLAASDAETLARFSLPEGTALRKPSALVPREDLPKRLAVATPIEVPTAVVPAQPTAVSRPREGEARVKAELWIMILPLAYTGYVAVDERFEARGLDDAELAREAARRVEAAVDARVVHEVRRLWFAMGAGPQAYLGLLPARRSRLEPLELDLDRGEAGPGARASALKKAIVEQERRKRAVMILDSVAQPVHAQRRAYHGAPPPLVGRERELDLLGRLLGPAKEGSRQSVLLVGRERVGKSALVQAFVDRELGAGRSPLVWATSGAALIAGMSGLGQWQERVRRVMEAASLLGAVVWFDDLADLFTERGRSSIDVPGALRPWVERGLVSVAGEMHEDRVDRAERQNVGFFASLARVRVPPFDAAGALAALRARDAWSRRHEPDAPRVAGDALAPIVDLADRYVAYEHFPGKAMRLYDELKAMHGDARRPLGVDEMYEAASLRTGVPPFLLREDRPLRLGDVVAALGRRVVGQGAAVRRVAEAVCVVKAGLQPRDKPLATFLFVGPTGVGKTELARALAEFLFGASGDGAERLSRFDMSEYTDALAADRLIRGDDRGEGVLTRKVREQPFCVLLLDEIEKAHPAVFDLLLQVCGEGRLTDAAGRTAYFHNAIVIMTSNLGAAERRAAVGFGQGASPGASHYERAVAAAFRPEFRNRIDRVVAFDDLGPEHRQALVTMAIERASRRRGLLEPGCLLSVSDAAVARLGEEGYSAAYGARALRRHVEQRLVGLVARALAARGDASDVDVDVRDAAEPGPAHALAGDEAGGLRASLVRRGRAKPAQEDVAMRAVSEARREIARALRVDRVAELREQVKFLVAQLGHGDRPAPGRESGEDARRTAREARDYRRLQSEHHRLAELLRALAGPSDRARAAEDAALVAYFRGESVGAFRREALAARAEFMPPLASALVALEPRRDECTVLVQELDDRRALSLYLPGLAEHGGRGAWSVEVHFDRGERGDAPDWPKDRRWGPPRPPARALERALDKDRKPLALLLRVRGPDAIHLALEGGLHRFTADDEPTQLFVHRVGLRTTFDEVHWPALDPDPPAEIEGRSKQPPARQHVYAGGRTEVAGRTWLELPPAEYWRRHAEVVVAYLMLCDEGKLDREASFRGRVPSSEDEEEIVTLLRSGHKLEAIKRYRELSGVGLKDAKDAVEAIEERVRRER